MNKTIWKFELETTGNQTLKMPIGAEILSVQTQFDKPCLWALVEPNAEKEDRVSAYVLSIYTHIIPNRVSSSKYLNKPIFFFIVWVCKNPEIFLPTGILPLLCGKLFIHKYDITVPKKGTCAILVIFWFHIIFICRLIVFANEKRLYLLDIPQ